jgi:hypothetical protein
LTFLFTKKTRSGFPRRVFVRVTDQQLAAAAEASANQKIFGFANVGTLLISPLSMRATRSP